MEIEEIDKNEWSWTLAKGFSFMSINNEIDPTVKLNIDSLNNFSFRDDSEEGDTPTKKEKKPEKKYNYGFVNLKIKEEILEEEINKLNGMGEIVEMELPPIKKKICGLFTKDDFDVKSVKKLNESFDEKFHNPLDDEDFGSGKKMEKILPPPTVQENRQEEDKFEKNVENEKKKSISSPQKEDFPSVTSTPQKEAGAPTEVQSPPLTIPDIPNPQQEKKEIIHCQQPDSSRNHPNNLPSFHNNDNPLANSGSLKNIPSDSLISSSKSNKETKEELIQTLKNVDSIDSLKKINELTEKLEKSENKFKIVNDTNNKLLEVINIFKVLQTIDKNQKKQNHSNNKSKKKVRSPSLNENFEKGNHDTNKKRSKSFSKGKPRTDKAKLYIDYIQTKKKTYTQIYGGKENRSHNYQTYKSLHGNKIRQIPKKKGEKAYNYNNTNSFFNYAPQMNISNLPQQAEGYNTMKNSRLNGSYEINSPKSYNDYHSGEVDNQNYLMMGNQDNLLYNQDMNNFEKEPNFNFYHKNNFGYQPNNPIYMNNINHYDILSPQSNSIPTKTGNKHKLLDFNAFQIIFDETEKNQSTTKGNKDYDIIQGEREKETKEFYNNGSYSEQINDNNNSNLNRSSEKVFNDSENYMNNSISNNLHLINRGINDKYVIPFYLLSQKEMYDNIVNYMYEKPKKLTVTYTRKMKKTQSQSQKQN